MTWDTRGIEGNMSLLTTRLLCWVLVRLGWRRTLQESCLGLGEMLGILRIQDRGRPHFPCQETSQKICSHAMLAGSIRLDWTLKEDTILQV